MSVPAPDHNPIFQSVIETAREFYKSLPRGGAREVQCSRDLLTRHEPDAVARVQEWAQKLGFDAREYQQTVEQGRGPRIAPPVLLIVTIRRP